MPCREAKTRGCFLPQAPAASQPGCSRLAHLMSSPWIERWRIYIYWSTYKNQLYIMGYNSLFATVGDKLYRFTHINYIDTVCFQRVRGIADPSSSAWGCVTATPRLISSVPRLFHRETGYFASTSTLISMLFPLHCCFHTLCFLSSCCRGTLDASYTCGSGQLPAVTGCRWVLGVNVKPCIAQHEHVCPLNFFTINTASWVFI